MFRIKFVKGLPYVYEQRSIRLRNGKVKTKTIRYLGRLTSDLAERLGITKTFRDITARPQLQGKCLSSKRKKKGLDIKGYKHRS